MPAGERFKPTKSVSDKTDHLPQATDLSAGEVSKLTGLEVFESDACKFDPAQF
jgi:hypothetical protein